MSTCDHCERETGMDRGEREFSIEMDFKEYMRTISISDKGREGVLFEGVLGEHEDLEMLEESILSVRGGPRDADGRPDRGRALENVFQ